MNLRIKFLRIFDPSLFKVQLVCDSTAASLAGVAAKAAGTGC